MWAAVLKGVKAFTMLKTKGDKDCQCTHCSKINPCVP